MFNKYYSRCRHAVCSIMINTISGIYIGTGWIYRNQTRLRPRDRTLYIVTAGHVVLDDNNQIINPKIFVTNVNGSGNNHIFNTEIISIDKKGDIALLTILNHRGENNKYPENWPSHQTLAITNIKQDIGIPIFIIGYPLGFDYNSFCTGHLKENNASEYFTPTSLYYDILTYGGNSGSPVLNTSNQVIGMLQWGLSNIEGMNGGISGNILLFVVNKMINLYLHNNNKNLYHSYFLY